MRIRWNRRYTTIALYAFIVLAGAITYASALNNLTGFWKMADILMAPIKPIVYGVAIAFLINPILKFFELKLFPLLDKNNLTGPGFRRAVGMLLAYFVAFLFVAGIFSVIIPGMIENIQGVLSRYPAYVELAQSVVDRLTEEMPDTLAENIRNYVLNYTQDILGKLYGVATSALPAIFSYTMAVTGVLLRFVMGLAVSVYLLGDKERFFLQAKKVTYALFSRKRADWLVELGRYTYKVFNGFIIGKIVDSIIVAILCFIGISLMGFKNAMLISIITGIFNMIPYVGPIIGAVPCFLIIVVDSPTQSLIWIAFIFALQQLDGNVIGPLVLGESLGLSAFWVFVAISIFGSFFGILGMFVGVPIFAVIYWVASRFINSRLQKKNISPVEFEAP